MHSLPPSTDDGLILAANRLIKNTLEVELEEPEPNIVVFVALVSSVGKAMFRNTSSRCPTCSI